MLSSPEERFLVAQRVGRLATADAQGNPHVVPVCFALAGGRNPFGHPAPAVVDRYDEDWTRLGWVMLRGRAEILTAGKEHGEAQTLLRARYPQLKAMDLAHLPVIALRIERGKSVGAAKAICWDRQRAPRSRCDRPPR